MTVVLVIGILMNAIALPIAGRRVHFLYRLITSGQPAPDRIENVRGRLGEAVKTQLVEVFGQKKLLKWSVPGAAHFFVFWAFLILASVYLEAYGSLFQEGFAIPIIGHWDLLGFLQDFIAVMALFSLATFAVIRFKNSPERLGRKSRFKGSHLGGAWLVLFMIFNVIWTMMLFRGAGVNTGHFPYGDGAFASQAVGRLLEPLGEDTNVMLEHIGLLLHIGVMLVFLIQVLNSKHLHIFLAPVNVLFGRRPVALGAVKPMMVRGEPVTMESMEELEEEDFEKLGVGKIEDFSWKGMLDFATCTECGRCQDQCPAWNTEKPLSPKLLVMGLRDHAFAKAPYLLADSDEERAGLSASVLAEAERPLVGETEGDAWHPSGGAVIDPDVLWSCVNCGACVEQCPVDIEHVDHIDDMRRYQVMVESNFPSELNNIFKGLERKGNPWGMDPKGRMDWAKGLDFEVKQVGVDVESLDEVEYLFWVGCAGAFEDRAKKTTQAVAEMLHMAGVEFAVLGDGETCTGDPARRAGNEVVFMQLAMENAEVFKETKVKKVVSTCAHCFNTLKNEYAEFGVELEVVHHTQLLNRLVREKKLTPVAPSAGSTNGDGKTITYHDPCFLGRHNQVYAPPRELLEVIPGATFTEMPRNSERSFCCGGGGARMWMEETVGSRINANRTEEAVATGADQIAVGCPFCHVMLSDGLTAQQAEGNAREEVEVLDVAQMLLASVKRGDAVSVVAEAEQATVVAADAGATAPAPETPEDDSEVLAKSNVKEEAPEPTGEDEPAVEEVPDPEPEAGADTVPFTDPQPSSKDVSEGATDLASDDDDKP
ncbi:heterodisulfide reductase-related iron-sulfur binding cluster [Aeromicrobium sp.]|uniref:heterodisulfide reductase-related iron-sulfur binding cluster n=1 Tax=Aeromicrobium sp. TaxID=1871063 RepID=UPI003D6C2442